MKAQAKVRSRVWLAVETIALLLAAVLLILMGRKLVSRVRVAREEAAARQTLETFLGEETRSEHLAQADERSGEFEKLAEENSDFRGWILFGEDRSLYVCQGRDNTYYMNHRFDGSEDPAGMIFMDAACTEGSDNLLIYGHNMKDGSRFGTLNRYAKPEFLKEHPLIGFQGDDGVRYYRPASVFYASMDPAKAEYFDFEQPEFGSNSDFRAYVDAAKARSLYDTGVDVKDGEKLLTLVTCSSEVDSGRMVVLCRMMRSREEP